MDAHGQAAGFEGGHHRGIGARGEDIVVACGEPARDGHHLSGRLALAEHRLGDAVAKGAMQIDAGEAEVVDGQVAEPRHRLLWPKSPGGDGLEELLYFFAIHLSASLALPLRNPCRSSVT